MGPYKGIQLFEANFNPNLTKDFNRADSSPLHKRTMSSLFIDTMSALTSPQTNSFLTTSMRHESISSYAALNSISSNASTMSIGSSSGSNEYGNDHLLMKKATSVKPKFEPSTSRALGVRLAINDKPVLCGRKLVDEHYEYLIEICVHEERWFILRRYSRIRQLHEQMSLIYP